MFWKRRIYLDYAAGVAGNPSSPHYEGRMAKKKLEDARTSIARLVEVQSDDVIFTSGATEANALAILGLTKKGDHMLYLPSAHASIVENAMYVKERGVNGEPLAIKDGQIDISDLKKRIRSETKLVVIEAVCGETGTIWNTREVKQAIGKTYLHVDASQAPLTEKITRAHFGADLLTLDASKLASRAASARLSLIARFRSLLCMRAAGKNEDSVPGSEAPELAERFAAALRAAACSREAFRASAKRMRTELIKTIMSAIPRVYINESRMQAPHILNLSLPGRDTDYLIALMDEAGFAVSSRSACETDSEDGSRAVVALTGDKERARATLRISWGPNVGRREFARFARALAQEVAFIDSGGQR